MFDGWRRSQPLESSAVHDVHNTLGSGSIVLLWFRLCWLLSSSTVEFWQCWWYLDANWTTCELCSSFCCVLQFDFPQMCLDFHQAAVSEQILTVVSPANIFFFNFNTTLSPCVRQSIKHEPTGLFFRRPSKTEQIESQDKTVWDLAAAEQPQQGGASAPVWTAVDLWSAAVLSTKKRKRFLF